MSDYAYHLLNVFNLAGNRLQGVVIRERREHYVHAASKFPRRSRHRCTPFGQGRGFFRRPVVDHERKSRIEQAFRDRRAHVAETDQSHDETRLVRGAHCSV